MGKILFHNAVHAAPRGFLSSLVSLLLFFENVCRKNKKISEITGNALHFLFAYIPV
jgi:hypothetical protein